MRTSAKLAVNAESTGLDLALRWPKSYSPVSAVFNQRPDPDLHPPVWEVYSHLQSRTTSFDQSPFGRDSQI